MKFRGVMTQSIAMKDFMTIINSISKMTHHCIMQLTPEDICFTVFDGRQPSVWAELAKDHFFSEYHLTGVSREDDKIFLEVDAPMFSKSLASLKQSPNNVKIKLTNKQQPCLTLEIELPSATNDVWHCVHDVPVKLVPKREWAAYKPPDLPDFHITLEMPQLKFMRNVVDKMKNHSPLLSLFAGNDGMLILKIKTDTAAVATYFPDLTIHQESNLEEMVSVTLDIKKILMFLSWEAVHPDEVRCSIVKERLVYLYLNLNDNYKIHYFLPAMDM